MTSTIRFFVILSLFSFSCGLWGEVDYGSIVNEQISKCPSAAYIGATNGLSGHACRIELPAGILTIKTPIHLSKTGVFIEGQGRGVTILRLANEVNLSVIQVGTNANETGSPLDGYNFVAYVNIEHLTVDGNASNQSRPCYGIHFARAQRITVRDLRIVNVKSHAIAADNGSLVAPLGGNTSLFRFHDLDIITPMQGTSNDANGSAPTGLYFWGLSDSIITGVDFNAGDFTDTGPSTASVWIRDCGDIDLADNMLSGGEVAGVLVEGVGNNNIRIHDNMIETPSGKPILVWYQCAECSIHDNTIEGH